MKKYSQYCLKIFILVFLCLLSLNKVCAVSYYDIIGTELDTCEKQGGKIVGMQDGKVVADNGCPGCFCQFKDGSICIMEQLGQGCEAGKFKSYFRVEEAYQLPDIKVGPGGTAGYVVSNPSGRQFYFIDKNSEIYQKLRYASADDFVKIFGTEWAEKKDAKYYLESITVCNGGNVETDSFDLYFNNAKLKNFSSILPGDCAYDSIYLMADIKNNPGKYEFIAKTNASELSKDDNIFSFSVDQSGFKYIKYYDEGEGIIADMPHPYYVSFDGKKVDATSLTVNNPQLSQLNNNLPGKVSWINKIINYLLNFFK